MSDAGAPTPGGLVLAPFRGWRYDEAVVGDLGQVLAPPYDVLTADDVRQLHARSPWNASELNRPASYASAAAALAGWISSGALRADAEPALYAYEQVSEGGVAVRGLLGALALSPPQAGIVLPHEDTLPGPVADRLALLDATGADLEPILVVYDGGDVVAAALDDAFAARPLAEAQTPDGVRHRLAEVADPAAVAAELLPRRALIADGHHRYATYLQRQRDRWAAGLGPGPWDFGLALLVDAVQPGLQVHAIHRVLQALPLERALARCATAGTVTELPSGDVSGWLVRLALAARPVEQLQQVAFVLAAGRRGYLVTDLDTAALEAATRSAGGASLRRLAVTAMARYLLPQVFGFTETDGVDVPDAGRAVALARDSGGTAVLLPPITFHEVLSVAAGGDRMPRKSTLFLPKPASGLVLRRVEEPAARLQPAHRLSDRSSTS